MENLRALAEATGSPERAIAKAAKLELERLAHSAGAPGADRARRQEILRVLGQIARLARPRDARSHAIRLLGLIGGRDEQRLLTTLTLDSEMREDAYMALERLKRR